MEFLLTFLLYVGIIILVVVGIVLLIIITFLFVPFKYTVYAKKSEDTIVNGKFSWFFNSIVLPFSYKENWDIKIKILWFSRKLNNKIEKNLKLEGDITPNSSENKNKSKTVNEDPLPHNSANNNLDPSNDLSYNEEKTINTDNKIQSKSKWHKIKNIYNILEFLHNYPNKKQILYLTINYFKDILKRIRPKSFVMEGEIGAGPYYTGLLLGAIALIVPTFSYNLKGNFNEKVLNLSINTRGSISLWSFAWPSIRFFLKKPIREIIKRILKG